MFLSGCIHATLVAAIQLCIVTAQSPGAPSATEKPRRLGKCSSEVPSSDVQTVINVVHHAVSTATVEIVTWITEVTTLQAKTECSTSIVIMVEPSDVHGLCESTATVIIPTTATIKKHVQRTTTVTSTPTSTRTVYSTSWVTQNAVPNFLNGPIEVPFYWVMSPGYEESSWSPVYSSQPRGQTDNRQAWYSPV